jgi:hypothetical protein
MSASKSNRKKISNRVSFLDSANESASTSTPVSTSSDIPIVHKKISGSNLDINIVQKKYTKLNGFISSKLVLELSGKDINPIIVNTLRRTALDDIPVYALSYVNIEQNTSKAFDNDYMRCRLRQVPLYDIKHDLFHLESEYYADTSDNPIQTPAQLKNARTSHPKEKKIEIFINETNKTRELKSVTSNDLTYYIDGNLTEYQHDKANPILLIDLTPGQIFKCQLSAYLGIGEQDSIWAGCKQIYYEIQDNPNNLELSMTSPILLTIEGNRQLDEYDLLIKCCKNICFKLTETRKYIKKLVSNRNINLQQIMSIELIGEDHTIGNLINNALQDHKDIIFED